MEAISNCFSGIKQELVENSETLERNILLPAANVLNETFFHHGTQQQYDSSDASSTKSRIVNESPEARARRLARNAQRMREKRANESFDEYKIRLAKNAEANRRKRQMESEVERAMRQVKDAARQRLRRAMESPEQRSVRLAKLAERMRMVRANESPDQRADRLKRSAARARERLSRETSEERRDRLSKRAEYARKMRSVTSSGSETSNLERSDSLDGTSRSLAPSSPTPSNIMNQTNNQPLLDGHSQQPAAPSQVHQVNLSNLQDFPPHSQNLVTLNNVKPGESQFNQFALNQNPLFLNFRPENYLNVPSYPNVFPDTQVPPYLQNYVQSLSLPLHPSQILSNTNCFPNALDHPSHHPASVIQPNPTTQNHNSNPFLGQHPSPFQPQHQHHHNNPQPSQPQSNNYSHSPPSIMSPHERENRICTPENLSNSSNDSLKQRVRGRPRKVFPMDDHGNPIIPEEIKDEVERQKVMNDLLEEQINIILSSPKRNRGRPNKGKETDNDRTQRLRKMAACRRLKRANETPEERSHRLQVLTDRARQRREIIKATETEEERKVRLSRQAEYARMRRVKEQTPDAKIKADQRAKELYAKLHLSQMKNENYSPPITTTSSTTSYNSVFVAVAPVNLRIPNPSQRSYNGFNQNQTNSKNSKIPICDDNQSSLSPPQLVNNAPSQPVSPDKCANTADDSKISANLQSNFFEPMIQMQTV